MSDAFHFNMNQSRDILKMNFPKWNCQCGQEKCIHTVGMDSPNGMTHVQSKKKMARNGCYLPLFEAGQSDLHPNVLMSQKARKLINQNKKNETTMDHMIPPQLIAYFIYDNADVYLADTPESYEKFREIAILCTVQCRVTKKQNRDLQQQTNSDATIFELTTPTRYKYQKADIKILRKASKNDRTDETQLGLSYDELEDAMQDEYSSNRDKYHDIRKYNLHKMEPIAVCKIPKS